MLPKPPPPENTNKTEALTEPLKCFKTLEKILCMMDDI